jgi:glucans biosynthesis protein
VQRRSLISAALAAPVVLSSGAMRRAAADDTTQPFDAMTVRKLAQALAQKPFEAPDSRLPKPIDSLTYDQYRDIRFDPAQSLWRGRGLPFEVQFFHRGFLYRDRVDIYEVADGKFQKIGYRPEMFTFGKTPRPEAQDLGFAGFRVHTRLNKPDYADEFAVFLGASYFRAVGRNEAYGLSARALSIKTGDSGGEEFPTFKAFWLERPQPGSGTMVVTALLDSASASGAMRATMRPGDTTVFDVELTLYPRVDITEAGIGTMTSMFYFNGTERAGIDDYRRAVHDSNGLMMLTGRGEALWRPLKNPTALQISSFADVGPRGFGLMQRNRDFFDFDDLEAHYERRPSLWAEPIGDWAEGVVELVEIPTKGEENDNIVAFWRPALKLRAREERGFTYRLHWGPDAPVRTDLARFGDSRSGAGPDGGSRLFVLDCAGAKVKSLPADTALQVISSVDHGKIQHAVAQPNPETGGRRISFELLPGDAKSVEIRVQLAAGDQPVSETWVYRWTA